ncbi:MAG: hypothetical protein Q9224_001034, partial [Gallowayella concinna]
ERKNIKAGPRETLYPSYRRRRTSRLTRERTCLALIQAARERQERGERVRSPIRNQIDHMTGGKNCEDPVSGEAIRVPMNKTGANMLSQDTLLRFQATRCSRALLHRSGFFARIPQYLQSTDIDP